MLPSSNETQLTGMLSPPNSSPHAKRPFSPSTSLLEAEAQPAAIDLLKEMGKRYESEKTQALL